MAIPNQISFLFLQIPSLLLFFWAQPSSAQFKPLCITQFALANHACSFLPSLDDPPLMADDMAEHQNDTNNNTDTDNHDDDHEHDDGKCKPKHGKDDDHKSCNDDDHKHGKDDDHKSCKDDDHKHGKDDDHKSCKDDDHKHSKDDDHDHKDKDDHANDRHHDDHNIPRAYKNCCRWLEMVDHECVCEALLKLPPFLVKQRHEYTMVIEKACQFSYKCLGV